MTIAVVEPGTPSGRCGLKQVVRSELVKITTLRSTLWTLLVTVGGIALVTILATGQVAHRAPLDYQGFDPTNQSLVGMLIAVLTMGVFGVLVVTGEYASGTIRTSLSSMPRRGGFLAGKAIVTAGGLVAAGVLLALGSFFVGQAVLAGGTAPVADLGQPGVARAVLMTGVFVALLGMLGMGLGLILRNTAGAISAYVGVAFLLPLLLNQVSHHLVRYTPVQMLSNSVAATVSTPGQVSPTVGLLLMGAYAAVALVVGAALFGSRDA